MNSHGATFTGEFELREGERRKPIPGDRGSDRALARVGEAPARRWCRARRRARKKGAVYAGHGRKKDTAPNPRPNSAHIRFRRPVSGSDPLGEPRLPTVFPRRAIDPVRPRRAEPNRAARQLGRDDLSSVARRSLRDAGQRFRQRRRPRRCVPFRQGPLDRPDLGQVRLPLYLATGLGQASRDMRIRLHRRYLRVQRKDGHKAATRLARHEAFGYALAAAERITWPLLRALRWIGAFG